jgi:hypothetical protein
MVEGTNLIERAIRIILIAGFLGVLSVEAWLLVQALLIPR